MYLRLESRPLYITSTLQFFGSSGFNYAVYDIHLTVYCTYVHFQARSTFSVNPTEAI
jgi:hypothetical protein